MNFKDTKRDEVLGHTATMRNLTTAAIIICPDLPMSGLQQNMHDPTKELHEQDILNAPAISGNDNGFGVNISTYLISDAIRKVHSPGVDAIFSLETIPTAPTMPEIDRIATNKTRF